MRTFDKKRYFEVSDGDKKELFAETHYFAPVSDFPEGLAPGKRIIYVNGQECVWIGGYLLGEASHRMLFRDKEGRELNDYDQRQDEVTFNPYIYPVPFNYTEISEVVYNSKLTVREAEIQKKIDTTTLSLFGEIEKNRDKKIKIFKDKGFSQEEIEILLG